MFSSLFCFCSVRIDWLIVKFPHRLLKKTNVDVAAVIVLRSSEILLTVFHIRIFVCVIWHYVNPNSNRIQIRIWLATRCISQIINVFYTIRDCITYTTKNQQQQQQEEKTTVENHLKIKRKTTFTRFLLNDKTVNISVVSNRYQKKNWDKITNTSYRLCGQRLNANSNLTLWLWFYRLITIYVI